MHLHGHMPKCLSQELRVSLACCGLSNSHTQGLAQIPSSGPSSLVDLGASGACLTLTSLALPRMPLFWL